MSPPTRRSGPHRQARAAETGDATSTVVLSMMPHLTAAEQPAARELAAQVSAGWHCSGDDVDEAAQ